VGHDVELGHVAALGRDDLPSIEIGEPIQVLGLDGMLSDAGFRLHRLGDGETLLVIGGDPGSDLIAGRLWRFRPLRALYIVIMAMRAMQ
jgi:hypothetical protein